uniref:Uncharacterized protein n=1 Tax=Arundo donax TaxID=35708 RepID=A0A0A9HPU5_ARUDO
MITLKIPQSSTFGFCFFRVPVAAFM